MTEAEKIAERYEVGDRWEDDDGVNIQELLEDVKFTCWDRRDGLLVYELMDGSLMMVSPGHWDLVRVNGSRWENSNGDPIADIYDCGTPKGWGDR